MTEKWKLPFLPESVGWIGFDNLAIVMAAAVALVAVLCVVDRVTGK